MDNSASKFIKSLTKKLITYEKGQEQDEENVSNSLNQKYDYMYVDVSTFFTTGVCQHTSNR